jgi:hypothetical protein
VKSLRAELAARTAEHESAIERLEETEGRHGALLEQMGTLQEKFDEAVAKARDEEALRGQDEDARTEQTRSLEEAARIAQAEADALRAELEGHRQREAAHTKSVQAEEELRRECDQFTAERDRLRDELAALRAAHEAHAADAALRLAQLETERDSARAEHGRLTNELEQLKADGIGSMTTFDRLVPNSMAGRPRPYGSGACPGSWKPSAPTAIGLKPSGSKRRARSRSR